MRFENPKTRDVVNIKMQDLEERLKSGIKAPALKDVEDLIRVSGVMHETAIIGAYKSGYMIVEEGKGRPELQELPASRLVGVRGVYARLYDLQGDDAEIIPKRIVNTIQSFAKPIEIDRGFRAINEQPIIISDKKIRVNIYKQMRSEGKHQGYPKWEYISKHFKNIAILFEQVLGGESAKKTKEVVEHYINNMICTAKYGQQSGIGYIISGSVQGIGKGVLWREITSQWFDDENCAIVTPDMLTNNNTQEWKTKTGLELEEVVAKNRGESRMLGELIKTIATAEYISYKTMREDYKKVRNVKFIQLESNHTLPIDIGVNDRRWIFCKGSPKTLAERVGDVTAFLEKIREERKGFFELLDLFQGDREYAREKLQTKRAKDIEVAKNFSKDFLVTLFNGGWKKLEESDIREIIDTRVEDWGTDAAARALIYVFREDTDDIRGVFDSQAEFRVSEASYKYVWEYFEKNRGKDFVMKEIFMFLWVFYQNKKELDLLEIIKQPYRREFRKLKDFILEHCSYEYKQKRITEDDIFNKPTTSHIYRVFVPADL